MRLLTRFSARALALAAILTIAAAASAAASPTTVVGHVYVNDNTSPVNTIAAFDRHADGTLTPVPGSPFATGGAGTGSAIGSQGALQTARHGRYLLAVDAGSDQISVLRIQRRRVAAPGARRSRRLRRIKPVSIAVHDRLVYVANAGDSAVNYTGFVLSRGRPPATAADSTVVAAGRLAARRRAVQRRRHRTSRARGWARR